MKRLSLVGFILALGLATGAQAVDLPFSHHHKVRVVHPENPAVEMQMRTTVDSVITRHPEAGARMEGCNLYAGC